MVAGTVLQKAVAVVAEAPRQIAEQVASWLAGRLEHASVSVKLKTLNLISTLLVAAAMPPAAKGALAKATRLPLLLCPCPPGAVKRP
jgi:hypothetical protein